MHTKVNGDDSWVVMRLNLTFCVKKSHWNFDVKLFVEFRSYPNQLSVSMSHSRDCSVFSDTYECIVIYLKLPHVVVSWCVSTGYTPLRGDATRRESWSCPRFVGIFTCCGSTRDGVRWLWSLLKPLFSNVLLGTRLMTKWNLVDGAGFTRVGAGSTRVGRRALLIVALLVLGPPVLGSAGSGRY